MIDGTVAYPAGVAAAVVVLALRLGWPRTLLALVAVGHLTILASVALFPIPVDPRLIAEGRAIEAAGSASYTLNLRPLTTILPVLAGRGGPDATRLLLLNALVLFPAGIYLPLLVPVLRRWRALVPFAIVGGASVELAQLAISSVLGFRYRSIDIDDAILNAVGLVLGWLVAVLGLRLATRADRRPAGRAGGRA
jgi:glycopeptide antibiotics resistance protein